MKINRLSKEEFKYVLMNDQDENGDPKEGATVWKLKPLSMKQLGQIEDGRVKKVIKEDSTAIIIADNETVWKIAKFGIVGWDNLTDQNNKAIVFESDRNGQITDELLDMIAQDIVTLKELSEIVSETSIVGVDDIKKLRKGLK